MVADVSHLKVPRVPTCRSTPKVQAELSLTAGPRQAQGRKDVALPVSPPRAPPTWQRIGRRDWSCELLRNLLAAGRRDSPHGPHLTAGRASGRRGRSLSSSGRRSSRDNL